MGRDEALVDIEAALKRDESRVAITALHGLRGVGKTTLAAAYAERHPNDYRATWWIRAQTEPLMRADLVALGVRLGWVGTSDKEESAIAAVMERLRHASERILLIFDNAINADAVKLYLPRGGVAKVLVTSNAHAWRGIASPIEIRVWHRQTGADYLIACTGRESERTAAETLSEALGGLPLAHEQAAAYCDRLHVSLADYHRRFEAATVKLLDDKKSAAAEYHLEFQYKHHDRLTVAGTFRLAIEEAAKLHPAAEPLIVHAALLAPEPIPLFLFSEAREKLGEPLATALADDGLDEVVAALRTFALIDRKAIVDERDTSITTDAIRVHRLVREVAAARREGESREQSRRALVAALAVVYPDDGYKTPTSWPRCASLTPHLLASCEAKMADAAANAECADLLNRAGNYFHGRAAYSGARTLFERALAIYENARGPEHPDTAWSLNTLAHLFRAQRDLARARPLIERALAIYEKAPGPEHPNMVWILNNLARVLQIQADLAGARPLFERALAICEKVHGPQHSDTAMSLNSLALVLQDQRDLAGARPLFERALTIYEKQFGPEHPDTTYSLSNLAIVLQDQGDLAGARPLFERALTIYEKVLGPEHPYTAWGINNLAAMLHDQGDLTGARPLFERALAIYEKAHGPEHPDTNRVRHNFGRLLLADGNAADALTRSEAALAAHEKILGENHPWTKDSARTTADALAALGCAKEASALRARHRIDEIESAARVTRLTWWP
jgi:tetratricopeptide (TPR) repeat protein